MSLTNGSSHDGAKWVLYSTEGLSVPANRLPKMIEPLLLKLPVEVFLLIASYLDTKSLVYLYQHSTIWKNLLATPACDVEWKQRCLERRGRWSQKPCTETMTLSWRRWFMMLWQDEQETSRGKTILSDWSGFYGNMGTMQVSVKK
jgi:hypothetical protein